jgi:hypothetical protein
LTLRPCLRSVVTTAVNRSLMPLVADDRPEGEERSSAQRDFLEHHGRERSVSPPIRRVGPLAHDTPSQHRDPHDHQVKEDRKRPAEHVRLPRDVCRDPATHQGHRNSGQPLPTGERRDLCASYHSNTVATDLLGFPGKAAPMTAGASRSETEFHSVPLTPSRDANTSEWNLTLRVPFSPGTPQIVPGRVISSLAFGPPNSFSPVSPSRWRSHAQTRHHRFPDGANHWPVHVGVSMQCVACPCRS